MPGRAARSSVAHYTASLLQAAYISASGASYGAENTYRKIKRWTSGAKRSRGRREYRRAHKLPMARSVPCERNNFLISRASQTSRKTGRLRSTLRQPVSALPCTGVRSQPCAKHRRRRLCGLFISVRLQPVFRAIVREHARSRCSAGIRLNSGRLSGWSCCGSARGMRRTGSLRNDNARSPASGMCSISKHPFYSSCSSHRQNEILRRGAQRKPPSVSGGTPKKTKATVRQRVSAGRRRTYCLWHAPA